MNSFKCQYCPKEFNPDGFNEYNLKKHENNCKYKNSKSKQIDTMFRSLLLQNGSPKRSRSNSSNSSSSSSNASVKESPSTSRLAISQLNNSNTDDIIEIDADNRPKSAPTMNNSSSDEDTLHETIPKKIKKNSKCSGYKPFTENPYNSFPFQLFVYEPQLLEKIVFENGVFHHQTCLENNYQLSDNGELNINSNCNKIQYNSNFKSILERAKVIQKHTNYRFLSYEQLNQVLEQKNQKINDIILKQLNLMKANLILNNKNSDFKRFVQLISTEDFPRLSRLLKASINHGDSVHSIIDKLKKSINHLYKSKKFTEKEIDLGILTLRIGGSRLLYAFNQANLLPSSSYIYKALQSSCRIEFDYNKSYDEIIKANISKFFSNQKSFYSIKLDEIAISPRVRWCPETNQIIGTCYNHKHEVENYEFLNWLNLEEIKSKLEQDKIHIAKECLVISITNLTSNDHTPKPIICIPICSHENGHLVSDIIRCIITEFKRLNPNSVIVNLATDGDLNRRKMLNKYREANQENHILSQLKLFPQNFLLGKFGINFDPKHLVKRLRGIIISDKRSITLIKRPINKSILAMIYQNHNKIETLINVKDHQNVPLAVQLLELLSDVDQYFNNNSITLADAKDEIKVLSIIAKLLLSTFAYPKKSLLEQLVDLAQLAHMLLYIFRKHKQKFITTDLYMDLQSTIQDAYICVSLFQILQSTESVYLFLLGTDPLESLFSIIRTITHARNCDFLELNDRLSIALQIENVLIKNPDLKASNRLSTNAKTRENTHDHSSISDWVSELRSDSIDLKLCWQSGKSKAEKILLDFGYKKDDLIIADDPSKPVTMMEPFGSTTVLPDDEANEQDKSSGGDAFAESDGSEDIQMVGNENAELVGNEDVELGVSELGDFISSSSNNKVSCYVNFDGKTYHKSNVINSLINCQTKLSSDRLTRVQFQISKILAKNDDVEENDMNFFKITDTVLTVARIAKKIHFVLVSVDKVFTNNAFVSQISSEKLNEAKLSGKVLIFRDLINDSISWSREYGETIEMNGQFCIPLTLDRIVSENLDIFILNRDKFNETRQLLTAIVSNDNQSTHFASISSPYSSSLIEYFEIMVNDDNSVNDDERLKCKVFGCSKLVKRVNMRSHVAKHILSKELVPNVHTCGYCGLTGCSIMLKKTSGSGKNATLGPISDCVYYRKFSIKSAVNSSCSNRPVSCQICSNTYWSYNLDLHYKVAHHGIEAPKMISEFEKNFIF